MSAGISKGQHCTGRKKGPSRINFDHTHWLFSWAAGILVVLCLPSFAASVSAQTPALSLDIDPRSGSLNDDFIFSVTLDGISSGPHPYLTGGDDFQLTLLGPSSQISMVNGNVLSRLSFRYRLIPKKTGTLLTPAAEIEIDGQKYKAGSLQVVVKPGPSAPSSAQGDAFLRQSVDKSKLFVGEQAVNSLELYAAVRLLSPQILDLSYDDFSNFEMGQDEQLSRMLGGKSYAVTRINRAIFPLKSGTLDIPARKVQAKIAAHRSRRFPSFGGADPFDDDFFGGFLGTMSYEQKVLTSNPLSLEVQPLPPTPPDFPSWDMPNPLVGETTVKVWADPGTIKVGESKTVHARVETFGNSAPLKQAPLNLGSAVRIYQESPQVQTKLVGGRLLFSREFSISMVPLREGALTVPSLRLGYFDVKDSSFHEARSEPISFEVAPNPLISTASIGEASSVPTLSASSMSSTSHQTSSQGSSPPPLAYQEPTWRERLFDSISLGASALFVAALALCVFLSYVARGAWLSAQSTRQLRRKVREATSPSELREILLFLLAKDNSGLPDDLPRLAEAISNPDLRFAATSLIDDMDRFVYGGATWGPQELQALKERMKEMLSRL